MAQLDRSTLRQVFKRTPLRPLVYWVRDRRAVTAWRRGQGAAPHGAKIGVVREYADRFGISILIETGTYEGDMVAAQHGYFQRVATIELDDALYEAAAARFAEVDNVAVFHGDSATLLPLVSGRFDQPAVFWLDAHYSGGVTARGDTDTPISAEINYLLSRSQRDVVLIDDARHFDGSDGYPTLRELELAVRELRPDLSFECREDIIRISPS